MKTKELVKQIEKYNEAYQIGESQISDAEYDALVEQLKEQDPGNKFFKEAIPEISMDSSRMETLPLPMFSLEKVKTVEELRKWVFETCQLKDHETLIITPKYDGISLLVDEMNLKAWTRGNGTEGQRSDTHFKTIMNGERGCVSPFYTWGEVIFPIDSFLKNKGKYKSARNCVAGLFNSPDIDSMLQWVHYVRYGASIESNKSDQLDFLASKCDHVTTSTKISAATFKNNDEVVRNLLDDLFRKEKIYKCDGIVIEVDNIEKRRVLGKLPNMNPRYAIAYKDPEWSEREPTMVTGIEWNVSKDGKVKPVIQIEPVDLCGATVSRASGYNAKYICDNHICEGANIVIARSGDVIPKHLQTLNYSFENYKSMVDNMMICPSCEEPLAWDCTHTELVCSNSNCEQRKISELVYFFDTLGAEEFGLPTIQKIYQAGYKTVKSILDLTVKELTLIEGIGQSLAETLCNQFIKLRKGGVPLARLMTAYNVFKGLIAEKTCQKIFDGLDQESLKGVENYFQMIPIKKLTAIEGIGEITAQAFNNGILLYSLMEDDGVQISYVARTQIKTAENQITVCFSGLRNKEWEEILINKGHKVASGVSKKTTHLVVKDKNSASSKTKKSKELGIPILDEADFVELLKTL